MRAVRVRAFAQCSNDCECDWKGLRVTLALVRWDPLARILGKRRVGTDFALSANGRRCV